MKKIYAIIAALFLFATPVAAEVTITDLPSAGTLDGSENYMVFRSGVPYQTTGTELTGAIEQPGYVSTMFDCTVDDDYPVTDTATKFDTIDDAWAAGCYKMFIANGSYQLQSDLSVDDPTETVWVVGESTSGVLLDSQSFSFRLTDTNRPLPAVAGTITVATGQSVITGTTTSWLSAGLTAGDMICPSGSYSSPCYEIQTIDLDTQITIKDETHTHMAFTGVAVAENTFFGQPYKDVRFEKFTWNAGSDELIQQYPDGVLADKSYIIRMNISDIYIQHDNRELLDLGVGMHWNIFNVHGGDTVTYDFAPFSFMRGSSTQWDYRAEEKSMVLGNSLMFDRAFSGAASVSVGNILSTDSRTDYSGYTGIAVLGNTMINGTTGLIETFYDSVNLPGELYMESYPMLQYDDVAKSISIGRGTVDPSTLDAGADSISIGYLAGDAQITGSFGNVFIGDDAGGTMATGDGNIGIGRGALYDISTGNYNIGIGFNAGLYVDDSSSYNIYIGPGPATNPTTQSYKLYIDPVLNNAPLIFGDFTDGSEYVTINGDLEVIGGLDPVDHLVFDYSSYDQATADGEGHTQGNVYFNTDDGTLDIMTDVSGVTIQVGQEVVVRARNAEVDTLNDGEVVYISGSTSGDIVDVKRAQADGTHAEAEAVGVVTADISAGGVGFVTCMGKVRGYNTTVPDGGTWDVGDPLYVSDTPGLLTNVAPDHPKHVTLVGLVARDANNGILFISKPDPGYELNEIHTVSESISPSLATGTVLTWDNVTGVWTDSETHTYTRHLQIPATEVGNPAQIPDKDDIGGIVGCYAFDGGASVEELHLQFEVPDDWDGGDIIFEIDTAPMVAMIDTETYTFDIEYRAIAEGEVLTLGTAATRSSSYTSSGATAQYYFTHPQATLDFDDANQPLVKQDHIFIVIDRNDADSYASDVCVTAFEIIYESTGLPRI